MAAKQTKYWRLAASCFFFFAFVFALGKSKSWLADWLASSANGRNTGNMNTISQADQKTDREHGRTCRCSISKMPTSCFCFMLANGKKPQ